MGCCKQDYLLIDDLYLLKKFVIILEFMLGLIGVGLASLTMLEI
jgi:hypothetical protein